MANNIAGAEPEDPWDWSVDQVVSELCRSGHDRPKWCSRTDHLPDPTLLESEIRSNDVTGEVLLTAVTKDVLRNDLNIKSMGQRHAAEKGINYLRSRSQKYVASFPKSPRIPLFTPVQSWLQNLAPPHGCPSNKIGSVSSAVPQGPYNSSRLGVESEIPESLPLDVQTAEGLAQPQPARGSPGGISSDGNAVKNPSDLALLDTTTNEIPSAPSYQDPPTKLPKRIAPTFVAHLDENQYHKSSTTHGGVEASIYPTSDHSDIDERDFIISGVPIADWRRLGISHTLKKELRPVNKLQAGHVEIPSRSSDIGSREVFEKNFSQGRSLKGSADADFRHLLAKYPPRGESEDVLDLYGDSGEEGNFDEETWQEMEKDAAEDTHRERPDRTLAPHDIERIIDKAIDIIHSSWHASRLPKVQAKAFRLWNRANRRGSVDTEIANAHYWVRRLLKSIAKIRQAIARDPWASESALRHQCQSLEESIYQQLEHQYNLLILCRPTPPPRPDYKSTIRQTRAPVDLAEGEIFLDSETDLSMGNFIEDDESEPHKATIQQDPPIPRSSTLTLTDGGKLTLPSPERQEPMPQVTPIHPSKNPFIETGSSISPAGSDSDSPATPPTSKHDRLGLDKSMPIELFSSSDPFTPTRLDTDGDFQTRKRGIDELHPSTPQRLRLSQPKPPAQASSDSPEIESANHVGWEIALNESDRRRALKDAFVSLPSSKADEILSFLIHCPHEHLHEALDKSFKAILNRSGHVEGVSEDHWDAAKMTALLFTSYVVAKKVVKRRHLDKQMTKKAQSLLDAEWHDFFFVLRDTMNTHQPPRALTSGKTGPSHAKSREGTDSTSDSDPALLLQTPRRKRRRYVKQNQMATSSQQQGHRRVQEDEQHRAVLDRKFQKLPGNTMGTASHSVNAKEPVIHLDPKIGEKVKDHQISGIRFLWRELTTDENEQGCLLAHTMGLGKTMQVISTLITIAQSAESPDIDIRRQVPPDLHHLTALILCPPSLIDNWFEEILMWRPEPTVLGKLYTITQRLRLPERVDEIDQWAKTGGILIISYDMFRGLIVNKAPVGRTMAEKPLNEKDHARVQDQLLGRPNVIIADEAHKMKNTEASISMATSRFRSSRRIALTGSPLANNLEEYFAMIDWIAPGYLGTREQFRSKYAIPIAEGLWNDSDLYDRRTSLRKLHVLKKNLDPKISRADITAIADDLPPKTEFFITVPLTGKQVKAYNLFIDALIGGKEGQTTGNARLWDWLAIMTLLCNHPSTFLTKLDDRQYLHETKGRQVKKNARGTPESIGDDAEGTGLPPDIDTANAELTAGFIEQQRKLFEAEEDSGRLEDPSLSHRSHIACEIVKLAMDAGDKVLLFSHSIPTLNYLQIALESSGCLACRMDGSTNVTKRQEAVKQFNKETSVYDVFIISTRAGGLGLNLQGANRVILFDYGFNPVWEEQAIGRAYRLGQRKAVFVYRLRAGGSFEELIYNKAVFKSQLSARVVDKKSPMRYASRKVADYLFHVKEVPQRDLSPFMRKDPLVLDRILSHTKYIRDIVLTETFQKEEDESLTPDEVRQATNELQDEQAQRRGQVTSERTLPRPQTGKPSRGRPMPPHFGQDPARTQGQVTSPLTRRNGAKEVFAAFQPKSSPSTTYPRAKNSISRPEATGSGQQRESDVLGQVPDPRHHNHITDILGAASPPTTALHPYALQAAIAQNQRHAQVQDADHLSYKPPVDQAKQLDGAADTTDGDQDGKQENDSVLEGCKSQ